MDNFIPPKTKILNPLKRGGTPKKRKKVLYSYEFELNNIPELSDE